MKTVDLICQRIQTLLPSVQLDLAVDTSGSSSSAPNHSVLSAFRGVGTSAQNKHQVENVEGPVLDLESMEFTVSEGVLGIQKDEDGGAHSLDLVAGQVNPAATDIWVETQGRRILTFSEIEATSDDDQSLVDRNVAKFAAILDRDISGYH